LLSEPQDIEKIVKKEEEEEDEEKIGPNKKQ